MGAAGRVKIEVESIWQVVAVWRSRTNNAGKLLAWDNSLNWTGLPLHSTLLISHRLERIDFWCSARMLAGTFRLIRKIWVYKLEMGFYRHAVLAVVRYTPTCSNVVLLFFLADFHSVTTYSICVINELIRSLWGLLPELQFLHNAQVLK